MFTPPPLLFTPCVLPPVNPGVVIGPVFTKSHTKASAVFLRDAIFGNKVMNFPATFVDVRDVAKAHINALEKLPEFHGRRFILTNDTKCFAQGAIELGPVAERALPGYKFEPQPRYPEAIMSVLRPLSRLPIVGRSIMSEVQVRRAASCVGGKLCVCDTDVAPGRLWRLSVV